jgi:biotin carboxyl carrier protein
LNVVIDGLYLTLVGLSVVFVVLILLMISIYFLNFFEDKFFSDDNNLVPKEVTGVKNSITKDIAAAVAVALYNKSKNKQNNDLFEKICKEETLKQFDFMINNEKFHVEILEETSENYKVKVNEEIIIVNKSKYQEEKDLSTEDLIKSKLENEDSKVKIPITPPVKKTGDITALMPGKVIQIIAKEGQKIKVGDPLVVIESMKMENTISSEVNGTIKSINIQIDDNVQFDQVLFTVI